MLHIAVVITAVVITAAALLVVVLLLRKINAVRVTANTAHLQDSNTEQLLGNRPLQTIGDTLINLTAACVRSQQPGAVNEHFHAVPGTWSKALRAWALGSPKFGEVYQGASPATLRTVTVTVTHFMHGCSR
jgi:hypothetical protein